MTNHKQESSLNMAPNLQFGKLRLSDFQLLIDIARTRSLTALAAQERSSQPSLSRSLKEIEDILGVVIFSRSKSTGMSPTEAGAAILERANYLLADAAIIKNQAETYSRGLGRQLRLGVIPYISNLFIQTAIEELNASSPETTIITTEGSTDQLVDALKRRELDAVLGRLHQSTQDSGLFQERLFTQTASLLVNKAHVALSSPPIPLAGLLDSDWVLPPYPSPTRLAFDRVFLEQGLQPPQAKIETTSVRLVYGLASTKPSVIALLPLEIGLELEKSPSVKCRPFPAKFPMPTVVLIALGSRRSTHQFRMLREALHKAKSTRGPD